MKLIYQSRVAHVCRVIQIDSLLFSIFFIAVLSDRNTNEFIIGNVKFDIRIGQTPVRCVHATHICVEEVFIGAALVG